MARASYALGRSKLIYSMQRCVGSERRVSSSRSRCRLCRASDFAKCRTRVRSIQSSTTSTVLCVHRSSSGCGGSRRTVQFALARWSTHPRCVPQSRLLPSLSITTTVAEATSSELAVELARGISCAAVPSLRWYIRAFVKPLYRPLHVMAHPQAHGDGRRFAQCVQHRLQGQPRSLTVSRRALTFPSTVNIRRSGPFRMRTPSCAYVNCVTGSS